MTSNETLIATSEMEATNQDDVMKTLSSQLMVATSAAPTTPVFNLTKANVVKVKRSTTHHVVTPKVGLHNATNAGVSFTTGDYQVNRVIWSDKDFDGSCDSGSCDGCDCPATDCDTVYKQGGRLSVLRLTPLSAVAGCEPDCGPDGPDGVVNIDDIVQVITHWGAGRGTWGDINDDGTVNIDDLVQIITHWGLQCLTQEYIDVGSLSSVEDCMDYADGYAERYTPDWYQMFDKCVQALCEAEIIDCD